MAHRGALLISLLLTVGCVSQPAVTYEYSSPSLAATFYEDTGPEQRELLLDDLSVVINVSAGFARTTLTASFANPSDEELEGKFTLQLPEQSVLTGYALDIEDVMLGGVIGASPAVQRAYEEKVRGDIDPGIGELTRRNEFVTEVYPIPEAGKRTIQVSFVTPHARGHEFALPLTTRARRFELTVHSQDEPRIEVPATTAVSVEDDNPRLATVEGKNVVLDGTLRVATRSTLQPIWARGRDGSLFAFLPFTEVPRKEAEPVRSLRLYWDQSLSVAGNTETLLEFADSLFALEDVRVELSTFNHLGAQRRSPEELRALSYGGGTSLAALFESELGRSPVDVCILVSDGDVSIGPVPEGELPCRLHTVTAASGANHLVLNELAMRHLPP